MAINSQLTPRFEETYADLVQKKEQFRVLLEKRKRAFQCCSQILSPITLPLCCCFCCNFEPQRKLDFLCTVLNPCICFYDEQNTPERFLIAPEVQEMKETLKKIVEIKSEERRIQFMAQFSHTETASTQHTSIPRRESQSQGNSSENSLSVMPQILQVEAASEPHSPPQRQLGSPDFSTYHLRQKNIGTISKTRLYQEKTLETEMASDSDSDLDLDGSIERVITFKGMKPLKDSNPILDFMRILNTSQTSR